MSKLDLSKVSRITVDQAADYIESQFDSKLNRLEILNEIFSMCSSTAKRLKKKDSPENYLYCLDTGKYKIPFSLGGEKNIWYPCFPFSDELYFNEIYKNILPGAEPILMVEGSLIHRFPVCEKDKFNSFEDYINKTQKSYRRYFFGSKSEIVKWSYCWDNEPDFIDIPAKCFQYWVDNLNNMRTRFSDDKFQVESTYQGLSPWGYGKQFLVYATDMTKNKVLCCVYNTIIGDTVSCCCIAHDKSEEYKKFALCICANMYSLYVSFFSGEPLLKDIKLFDWGINHTVAGDYKEPYINKAYPLYNVENFSKSDVTYLLNL